MNKKQKIFIYKMDIPIFNGVAKQELQIFASKKLSYNELLKKINGKYIKCDSDYDDNAAARIFIGANYHAIVFGKDSLNVGTIVHETMHFSYSFLCRSRSINLSEDTDEVYAYFMDYFCGKIYNRFKKDGLLK